LRVVLFLIVDTFGIKGLTCFLKHGSPRAKELFLEASDERESLGFCM
jgi:hypothetical protein